MLKKKKKNIESNLRVLKMTTENDAPDFYNGPVKIEISRQKNVHGSKRRCLTSTPQLGQRVLSLLQYTSIICITRDFGHDVLCTVPRRPPSSRNRSKKSKTRSSQKITRRTNKKCLSHRQNIIGSLQLILILMLAASTDDTRS